MKPFSQITALTPQQKTYNYSISRARIVVENAYGRLKARWHRLLKRNDMKVSNIRIVIAAACVLHNICEIHGDAFNGAWLSDEASFHNQTLLHIMLLLEIQLNKSEKLWYIISLLIEVCHIVIIFFVM